METKYYRKSLPDGVHFYRIQSDNYTHVFRGNDGSKFIKHELFETIDTTDLQVSNVDIFNNQFRNVINGMFIDGIKL